MWSEAEYLLLYDSKTSHEVTKNVVMLQYSPFLSLLFSEESKNSGERNSQLFKQAVSV